MSRRRLAILTAVVFWGTSFVVSAIVFLTVRRSLLSCLFCNYSPTRLSASAATGLLNPVPVVDVVCPCLVLHETVSARQILGALVIVAGVRLNFAAVRSVG